MSKQHTTIRINAPKPRTGAYAYKNGQCTMDNRPKRLRTRATRDNRAIKEY